MRAYGATGNSVLRRHKSKAAHWEDDLCGDGPVKGRERIRVRLELQKAIGPVPPSVMPQEDCTCENCASDPAYAAMIRGLEQHEHDHLDEITV